MSSNYENVEGFFSAASMCHTKLKRNETMRFRLPIFALMWRATADLSANLYQ